MKTRPDRSAMYKRLKQLHWNPPPGWERVRTVDMHTGGEPLRILVDGYPRIPGNTILEKRRYFMEHHDSLRKGIIWEPRGHADMYGAVITDPCSEGSDFGTFFLHNDGYSTMCGHAIIALTKFVLDTRLIRKRGKKVTLQIDAPPGRIVSRARRGESGVESVSFTNVPSFVLFRDRQVEVPGLGMVAYDVAYGGAFYAIVDAEKLGLSLDGSGISRLIEAGQKIKQSVGNAHRIQHPFEEDLSFLYGTIFTAPSIHTARHSRNVCIFANGELDRSATGSGVSARAALHYARGELRMGERVAIESILGTVMEVSVGGVTPFGPHTAIVPEVTGTASFTGSSEFWFDPFDSLREGFFLR